MRHACERICACKRKDREIPDITHTTLWVVFYLVVSAAIIPRPRGGVGRVSMRMLYAAVADLLLQARRLGDSSRLHRARFDFHLT